MASAHTAYVTDEATSSGRIVTSLGDLVILECWDGEHKFLYTSFCYVDSEYRVFFGKITKRRDAIDLDEYNAALELIPDNQIYPEIPTDIKLTIAEDDLDISSLFIKQPGLSNYGLESLRNGWITNQVLHEVRTMEAISKVPHPHIIRYHGCITRRGRITALLFEKLDHTLGQYFAMPNSEPLNNAKFMEALESAVNHLHSLELAHNDINPCNIMVKDGMPVLIDFGLAKPFGERISGAGTEGWTEEDYSTSELKHDIYPLKKLREWLKDPKLEEFFPDYMK